MAVIKNVHLGVGDRGFPCLWFDTYISESAAALQVFAWGGALDAQKPSAYSVLLESGVSDVAHLAGKTCWVEVDGGMIKFLKMAQI